MFDDEKLATAPLERVAYRPAEVCAVTGLSKTKIYQLLMSGELPSRFVSGCRLVSRADLIQFIDGPQQGPARSRAGRPRKAVAP